MLFVIYTVIYQSKFDYDTGTDVFDHQGVLDHAIEARALDDSGLGFFQVGGRYDDTLQASVLSTYRYKH